MKCFSQNIIRTVVFAATVFSGVRSAAAEESMNIESSTIADILAGNEEEFSSLSTLIQMAGLYKTLNGPGPITLFAPTNEAFAALSKEEVKYLTASENEEELVNMLMYHLIPGKSMSTDFVAGNFETGSGQKITFSMDPVTINTANVITVDIEASNGVIHVIDAVLDPNDASAKSETESSTIVEIIAANDGFSSLASLIQLSGLYKALNGPGPITMFAPTNNAIAALPQTTLDDLTADGNGEALRDFLKYHLVSGMTMSEDFVAGNFTTGSGESVAVSLDPLMINTANVITVDIQASNGVIHVIDSVLLPDDNLPAIETNGEPESSTLFDILVANENLTAVTSLIELTGFDETLNGPGPISLFAPTNEAIATLPDDLVTFLTADENEGALNEFLMYHLVPGKTMSADFVAGDYETLSGETITVSLDPMKINFSNVIVPDLEGSNGVVHIIDSILLPNGGNVQIQPLPVPPSTSEPESLTKPKRTRPPAATSANVIDTLITSAPTRVFATKPRRTKAPTTASPNVIDNLITSAPTRVFRLRHG